MAPQPSSPHSGDPSAPVCSCAVASSKAMVVKRGPGAAKSHLQRALTLRKTRVSTPCVLAQFSRRTGRSSRWGRPFLWVETQKGSAEQLWTREGPSVPDVGPVALGLLFYNIFL